MNSRLPEARRIGFGWKARGDEPGRKGTLQQRRAFVDALVAASSVFPTTGAQEGYYGVGHDKWHQGFYSKPKMPSRFLSFANC
jgi:hypothetical protein